MKTHKKKKKSVDIHAEINGKSVSIPSKKEKKLDLTEEIKKFIKEDTDIIKIKRILLRLLYTVSDNDVDKATISVLQVSKFGYFITICHKKTEIEYYINSMNFIRLSFWKETDIVTSRLKDDLRRKIYQWITQNVF